MKQKYSSKVVVLVVVLACGLVLASCGKKGALIRLADHSSQSAITTMHAADSTLSLRRDRIFS